MYKELKLSFPTREIYNQEKENINPDALIFIEDEEVFITPFKEYQFVISGGKEGQVLQHAEDGLQWQDLPKADLTEIEEELNNKVEVTEDDFTVTEIRIVDSEDDPTSLLTKREADETYAGKEELEKVYYVEIDNEGNLQTSQEECAEIFNKLEANPKAIVKLRYVDNIFNPIKTSNSTYLNTKAYYASYYIITSGRPILDKEIDLILTPINNVHGSHTYNRIIHSFDVGKGLEMTQDRVLNCTLDTTPWTVVESLPDEPEEGNENKLHLVRNSEGKEDNLFDEYLWVNDEWEKIGEAKLKVDLGSYVTFDDVATSEKNGLVDKKAVNNLEYLTTYGLLIPAAKEKGGAPGLEPGYNIRVSHTTDTASVLFYCYNNKHYTVYDTKATIDSATSEQAGVMSASDKSKLDSINLEELTEMLTWYKTIKKEMAENPNLVVAFNDGELIPITDLDNIILTSPKAQSATLENKVEDKIMDVPDVKENEE